ncbi:ABC transporter substrate-binding protein [Amycolatopsis alkalitolerans]|uniref:ABC transporter substrate-binding protein n=1 Tax=Amycolatopsis alkalitolerans TaxID=2547244 RepID=A0A5C4LX74_9PSEU|nr:ABC transporter substrate-binding protein [Amycolatopsis alkalitolerans]TNC24156.1 ABC transporter substrate-binding protein [Amycolatopsis alkalitolerans]
MITTRSRAGGIVALAVLFGASACGVGTPSANSPGTVAKAPELAPGQQVSIVFESYNFGLAGTWTDTFNELIGQFEKKYPNIKVTPQKPTGSDPNPAHNSTASVQTEIAAGNPPDVAQLGFDTLDFAVNQLGAQPLPDLVGKSELDGEFGGQFPYAQAIRTIGDYHGKTYGVPFVLSTPVLYYNATLFRQAGLNPDDPPKTWDEVLADGQKIKQATGKDGAYADCLTRSASDWCFQSLVRSNGGRVLSPDRTQLTFDQPQVTQVVKKMQDMVNAGATPKLSQLQATNEMPRGDLGMMLESSAAQGGYLKGAKGANWELRAAPMPSFGGQPTVPTNSGAALYVFSKDPAKQRAAWDLIKFLTSPQAYDTITSKIGYLPLRLGLLNDPAHLQPWAAKNPLIKPNVDQLSRVEPWVAFPGTNFQQIRDAMMDAVEKSVYQGADPQASLTAAKQQVASLVPAK